MKIFLSAVALSLLSITNITTTPSEKIVGVWLTSEKESKVEIYKKGTKYFGKIVWIKESIGPDGKTKLDVNNPDADKRSRPLIGLNIVTNLEWDVEDKEWNEGNVYDPESGSTYSVFAEMIDDNTLFLKGYIGFSLLGRSTEWTRVK